METVVRFSDMDTIRLLISEKNINIADNDGLVSFDFFLSTAEAEETTGISESVTVKRENVTTVYDLQGQAVKAQLKPGIYIVNRKGIVPYPNCHVGLRPVYE